IYPTVVIEGTVLAEMWKRGEYIPLSEEEALSRSADILSYFNSEGIKVLRCGLHPSEELSSGGKLLAGPFHPAFRLKAESIIFGRMLRSILDEGPDAVSRVSYNPDDECALRGYGAMNSSVITELRRLKPDGFLSPSSNVTRGRLAVERNV
ncbi:MAG: hypothetical protein PHT95_03870, partial [Candidatus Omnitrophica bacterium]|nr:hypothetical protein [Candidatus Omnitrophota bacterium]